RRERSCSVEIPGRTRWSSTNLRGPTDRSRTISKVHLSPTRSSARASGDHWSYGCRFGGGTCGIEIPPYSMDGSYQPTSSITDVCANSEGLRQFSLRSSLQVSDGRADLPRRSP